MSPEKRREIASESGRSGELHLRSFRERQFAACSRAHGVGGRDGVKDQFAEVGRFVRRARVQKDVYI